MNKVIILLGLFICNLFFFSCNKEEKTFHGGFINGMSFNIVINDMEGNCLLDSSYSQNIVKGDVYMSRNGKVYPLYKNSLPEFEYDIFYLKHAQGIHPTYISPMLCKQDVWYEKEKMIIHWGDNIENDTIEFTGGMIDCKYYCKLTINGVELKKYNEDAPYYDLTYLYQKDMSKKK